MATCEHFELTPRLSHPGVAQGRELPFAPGFAVVVWR